MIPDDAEINSGASPSADDSDTNGAVANPDTQAGTGTAEGRETRTFHADFASNLGPEDLPNGIRDHHRYRVIRLIGHGGMGKVYLAEHRLMGRVVALKTIRLMPGENPAVVERFLREVRASAKLNHPNVVSVFDAESTADSLFLVMEYLEGEDLYALVRNKGRLDPSTACTLLYQATEGVKHAHDRGVIHRDIKPNNLFLVRSKGSVTASFVKVLDFGLAKVLQDAGVYEYGTPSGFAMGTVGYMSPEQAADTRSVGIQADIFSLGRTLYYLLSKTLPYSDGIHSLRKEESGQNPVIPLSQLCPDVPVGVCEMVEKMTAIRVSDRFQSCDELLSSLAPLCRT